MADQRVISILLEYEHRARSLRLELFNAGLINDSSWPLVQDLFAAHLRGEDMRIVELCATSGLPLTTVLRYLDHLQELGAVARRNDPHDLRVTLVSMTASGASRMMDYYTILVEAEENLAEHDAGVFSLSSPAT